MLKKIMACVLAVSLMTCPVCMAAAFSDMENHWAKEIVEKMAALGVVNGISDTEFDPAGDVTRAEFSAMLARALGLQDAQADGRFSDVDDGDWFAGPVTAMAQAGMIAGYGGTFQPEENITHEEAVKICVAAYERERGPMDPGAFGTVFDDYFEIADWARSYVNKGVVLSIAQGYGEEPLKFKPQAKTTRAQAAVMIYHMRNAIEISGKFGGEAK